MTTLPRSELRAGWAVRRKSRRRLLWLTLLLSALIFLLCLCVRFNAYAYAEKFLPLEYFKSYALALRLLFSRLTGGPLWYGRGELIGALGETVYNGALAQLRMALMSFAAGASLSLSGVIFQTAYRNPMASPNIIGASAGVMLGNVAAVTLYSAKALENLLLRYEFCYGFTIICVGLVMLLAKLSSRARRGNFALSMIMAGAAVSQLFRVFTQYFRFRLADAELVLFERLSLGVYLKTDAVSMAVFFGVTAAAIAPILLTRYRLNVLGMERTEAAALGAANGAARVMAQLCGAVMFTCATIHYGMIGMVSLVVPYLLRRLCGSEFSRLGLSSVFAGGALLTLLRTAASFIEVEGAALPVTFAAEFALIPIFAIILSGRKGAENET